MATINVLGVPCAYDLTDPTSSSPVLVFVHGWLLSRGYWQPLIELLSPTYQCLAYDLRGFGRSQLYPRSDISSAVFPQSQSPLVRSAQRVEARSPEIAPVAASVLPGELVNAAALAQEYDASGWLNQNHWLSDPSFHISYTPAAYAKDLAVLLKLLNLSNVWLVGHSLGGIIALWTANQVPNLVKGVICLNAGGGIYLKEEFERFRMAGQQILKLRPRWLCHLPLIDLMFARSTVLHPINRTWRRLRLLDFVMAHPEAALGALLDSTTEAEVNRLPMLVSALEQPVYFLAGAKDPVMQPNYVRHLASFHHLFGTCGDNVIEIEDCGHMAMIEQPESVSSEIYTILNRYSGRQIGEDT